MMTSSPPSKGLGPWGNGSGVNELSSSGFDVSSTSSKSNSGNIIPTNANSGPESHVGKNSSYSSDSSYSTEDFREILSTEVVVDLPRLKELSMYGIPNEIRCEVWRHLLGVSSANKSREVTDFRAQSVGYSNSFRSDPEVLNRVRGELKRVVGRDQHLQDRRQLMENVLGTYLNYHTEVDFSPSLVHMCVPIVHVCDHESEVYYIFERIMDRVNERFNGEALHRSMSEFLHVFRSTLPDLYEHFEEQEVEVQLWASNWLRHIFCTELKLKHLLRLWDAYFSLEDGFQLHIYACIAVLESFSQDLEEYEHSELRSFLRKPPRFDVDQIIQRAKQLKQDFYDPVDD
eukprot:Clim_evm19s155 gene=Clim_evmTU19s155